MNKKFLPVSKIHTLLIGIALIALAGCAHQYPPGKHLFILSGQSNMENMDPEQTFVPTLEKEFGKNNIIVVKDAMSAQYIYRWYKNWRSSAGQPHENSGDLYERLITKVKGTVKDQPISTITFVWMQGEADAMGFYDANVYESSLLGIYTQLQHDFGREDIYWVIGRISDFDLHNAEFKRWTNIREIQVRVAESDSRFTWVDTDDLNDGIDDPTRKKDNDLHYSNAGYKILGKRFAESAIELIKQNNHFYP